MSSPRSTLPKHSFEVRPLTIALLGRSEPSHVEALAEPLEQLHTRLMLHGHAPVTAEAPRPGPRSTTGPIHHLVSGLHRPAADWRRTLHEHRPDVAFVLDPSAATLAPAIASSGVALGLHVADPDLDRSPRGRRRAAARRIALSSAGVLIADTRVVQERYLDEVDLPVELIRPGTRILRNTPTDLLWSYGLVPGAFHVTTLEGGIDRTAMVLEGYHRSAATLPLVVIGRSAHHDQVDALAARDPRLRILGDVDDVRLVEQLHAHALSSLHARPTGTVDNAMLRAMGAATAVVALDTLVNRETAGTAGSYFSSAADVARRVEEVEQYPFRFRDLGELMQERAHRFHDWDVAAEQYAAVASRLAREQRGRHRRPVRRIDRPITPVTIAIGRG